jgi:Ca-activated chloride channel family protein
MQHSHTLTAVARLATALIVLAAAISRAEEIKVTAALGHPVLLADQKQTSYLKVSLTGFSTSRMEKRTPVNVAIVLDRSGSMTGEKLRKAKEAAIMAIERLGPNDIVSVVAFDDTIRVIVPATKLSDRFAISSAIERIEAGNRTALFAAVSKGAAEVRKFLDRHRVNRVILLSDGNANVGPSSPSDLAELGASLIKEGISVTTVGLGSDFNEDLMTQLARRSDGNHAFAEDATDLARIFNHEFGDILSVCAQELVVRIRCASGIRPVRVLGREADITGSTVTVKLNQLYSDQQKFVMLEVEVPPVAEGRTRDIASVSVFYANMATKTAENLSRSVAARFSASTRIVTENENADVMAAAIEMIAVENSKRAMALRDSGKIEDARKLLLDNAQFCLDNATKYKSESLHRYRDSNFSDAQKLDDRDWGMSRKGMARDQYMREKQQMYR